jgi:hypothetical protein
MQLHFDTAAILVADRRSRYEGAADRRRALRHLLRRAQPVGATVPAPATVAGPVVDLTEQPVAAGRTPAVADCRAA